MKKIVVLGAGFAGLTLASELNGLAQSGQADVVLIDRSLSFAMGFSMQWALAGRREFGEGQKAYAERSAQAVRFVHDDAIQIDTAGKTVRTRTAVFEYDFLVIALGAAYAPERVPGLADAAFNLCDAPSVAVLKEKLDALQGGTLLIAISSVPFKCPPAPYEYAFLMDDLLRKRGVRDRVRLVVSTPEPQPMPVAGPVVGAQVVAWMKEKSIEYWPNHKPVSVDAASKTVRYENGASMSFDLMAAMYPHCAPDVVRQSGLTDDSGFVPVQLGTFATAISGVYAVGDVASIVLPNGKPHPKAGIFAEAQAKAIASQIKAKILGGTAEAYSGRGACFIDVGNDQAVAAEADLLAHGGPRFELSTPSGNGLEGKRRFEQERLQAWFGTGLKKGY